MSPHPWKTSHNVIFLVVMCKWPLPWSSCTNLMSGEPTRYHTKYFKLANRPSHTNNPTLISPSLSRRKCPESPFWSLLLFRNGKNNSSKAVYGVSPFCQNLFLPPVASSFVQWTSKIRKWDYLWDYHCEIINSVHRHINSCPLAAPIVQLQWHQMFEQYFDAKLKPLSQVFSLKIIFGKKQTIKIFHNSTIAIYLQ